jgi:hypothetical protein
LHALVCPAVTITEIRKFSFRGIIYADKCTASRASAPVRLSLI